MEKIRNHVLKVRRIDVLEGDELKSISKPDTIKKLLSFCDSDGNFAVDLALIEMPLFAQAGAIPKELMKGTVKRVWYCGEVGIGSNYFNFGKFNSMGRPSEVIEKIPVNYVPVYGSGFRG